MKFSGFALASANWVMGELSAALNRDDLIPENCPLPASALGKLIERIKDGTISGKIAKSLFDQLWKEAGDGELRDVDAIIEAGRSLTPPTKILSALVVCSRKDQELQVTITTFSEEIGRIFISLFSSRPFGILSTVSKF